MAISKVFYIIIGLAIAGLITVIIVNVLNSNIITTSPATTPYIQTTTPYIQTTTPYMETTTPYMETTTPYMETTTPYIQTTTPYMETTTPYIQTTTPYINVFYTSQNNKKYYKPVNTICDTMTGIQNHTSSTSPEGLLEYCSTDDNLGNGGRPCIGIVSYGDNAWYGCTSRRDGEDSPTTITYLEG